MCYKNISACWLKKSTSIDSRPRDIGNNNRPEIEVDYAIAAKVTHTRCHTNDGDDDDDDHALTRFTINNNTWCSCRKKIEKRPKFMLSRKPQ